MSFKELKTTSFGSGLINVVLQIALLMAIFIFFAEWLRSGGPHRMDAYGENPEGPY